MKYVIPALVALAVSAPAMGGKPTGYASYWDCAAAIKERTDAGEDTSGEVCTQRGRGWFIFHYIENTHNGGYRFSPR